MISINFSVNMLNNITTPILMKLFVTKIVANNFFGDFKSFEIVLVDFKLSLSNESICDLVRENNATT